jgi:beta-carotene 15,15'-dioxygenase
MNAIKLQGQIFCGLAVPLTVAVLSLHKLNQQTELIILGVLIVILGVPHGALDTIFAKQLYNINTLKGWVSFLTLYVVLAAAVVSLWQITPVLFLISFLIISLFHFSGDPVADTHLFARVMYGGAIIVLPALLHADEVTQLFSFLVDINAAKSVASFLHHLSFIWIAGVCVSVALCWRKDWQTALEILSVVLIAVVMPPLPAFTVFFCAMHSARHILRTLKYSGKASFKFLILAATMPMAGVLAASIFSWYWLRDTPIDARAIQLIFVGLAALTVPHMALVERVRLSGWIKGAVHVP